MFNQENIVLSFLRFLRKPDYSIATARRKTAVDVLNIFILIVIGIVINTALVTLNSHLFRWAGYDIGSFSNGMDGIAWWFVAFMILVQAPVLETFTYQLGLRYSLYGFSFTIVFILIEILGTITNFIDISNWSLSFIVEAITNPFVDVDYLILGAFVLISGFILAKIFKKLLNEQKMRSFYSKYFTYIFYGLAILFALTHLSNLDNLIGFWYLIPFMILPQFVGALILGFIRMKWGVGSTILAHSANNLLNEYILLF